MVLNAYSRSRICVKMAHCTISLKYRKKIRTCIRGRHELDSLHSPISPRLRRPQGIIRHDVYATHAILTDLRGASRGFRVISKGLGVTIQALSAGGRGRANKLSDKLC